MALINFCISVALAILPIPIFGFFGFRRWKAHYGGDSSLSEYFWRYVNGKRATDDPWPVFALKVAVFVSWFMLVTSLLG